MAIRIKPRTLAIAAAVIVLGVFAIEGASGHHSSDPVSPVTQTSGEWTATHDGVTAVIKRTCHKGALTTFTAKISSRSKVHVHIDFNGAKQPEETISSGHPKTKKFTALAHTSTTSVAVVMQADDSNVINQPPYSNTCPKKN